MTYVFGLVTEATPQRVWAVLTTPELTAQYLSGLGARSTWRPGSSVSLEAIGQPGAPSLTVGGEVLAAEEPTRLSYTLTAGRDQPTTYVTWEVIADGAGAAIRLSVDEPDELTSGVPLQETQEVWSQVVARLASVLARSVSRPSPA
ncbi:MAG TPA: SRPBCC domain-containing protein [Acidimicrobiales bacterium]|nr:SRPBCC domain-containing protein [Acidimicrobiales bacterium]